MRKRSLREINLPPDPRPDPDGYVAACLAGLAIGAIIGITASAILWTKEVGTLAPIAVSAIGAVAGAAISVIAAAVRRRS